MNIMKAHITINYLSFGSVGIYAHDTQLTLSLLSASILRKNKWTTLSRKCIKIDTWVFVWHFYQKKFWQIFLLKISYKNSSVNYDAFSRQNSLFIFSQNWDAQKQKC